MYASMATIRRSAAQRPICTVWLRRAGQRHSCLTASYQASQHAGHGRDRLPGMLVLDLTGLAYWRTEIVFTWSWDEGPVPAGVLWPVIVAGQLAQLRD